MHRPVSVESVRTGYTLQLQVTFASANYIKLQIKEAHQSYSICVGLAYCVCVCVCVVCLFVCVCDR